jgi:hypothetical protein
MAQKGRREERKQAFEPAARRRGSSAVWQTAVSPTGSRPDHRMSRIHPSIAPLPHHHIAPPDWHQMGKLKIGRKNQQKPAETSKHQHSGFPRLFSTTPSLYHSSSPLPLLHSPLCALQFPKGCPSASKKEQNVAKRSKKEQNAETFILLSALFTSLGQRPCPPQFFTLHSELCTSQGAALTF